MKKLVLTVALALIGYGANSQFYGVYTYGFKDRKTLIVGQWVRFKGLKLKNRITFLDQTEYAKDQLNLLLGFHGINYDDFTLDNDENYTWSIDMQNGFVLHVIYKEDEILRDYAQLLLITEKL